MYLVITGMKKISLRSLSVETSGDVDLRKGSKGFEDQTPGIDNIKYTVCIDAKIDNNELQILQKSVEKICPLYNLIKTPNDVIANIICVTDVENVGSAKENNGYVKQNHHIKI